jgi:hypothetical protein
MGRDSVAARRLPHLVANACAGPDVFDRRAGRGTAQLAHTPPDLAERDAELWGKVGAAVDVPVCERGTKLIIRHV